MSGYHIYLSFNNQEKVIELPVNPSQLEISEAGNLQSFDIVGIGEVVSIHTPKLADIQFSSLFPLHYGPYVHIPPEKLLPPSDYIIQLREWMETKRPIRFVLTTPTYHMNLAMAIDKFTWREVAGSVGDLEYDISLKLYKFYAAKKVKLDGKLTSATNVPKPSQPRPDERKGTSEYMTQPGDKLSLLAQKFFNDTRKAIDIQRLNGISAAEALHELEPNRVLRLPRKK
ncbi:peptidoglycan-binding protein [Paenibacillus alvei]|uniref:Peptidoglycan-binding protein n=1 Tax=Paenibacillus alvei TaxID=44250 RepID=A0ABT4E3R7_PAEAL|nr:peptidoglycan-binding protein [Paenibacillus alvei]MCY9528387.1 peptidoglycan-binding protein [Paenibacillus alvei]